MGDDLQLLLFLPRLVHHPRVFLPCGIVRQRFERARHRHAGEKMRRLVDSDPLLRQSDRVRQKKNDQCLKFHHLDMTALVGLLFGERK